MRPGAGRVLSCAGPVKYTLSGIPVTVPAIATTVDVGTSAVWASATAETRPPAARTRSETRAGVDGVRLVFMFSSFSAEKDLASSKKALPASSGARVRRRSGGCRPAAGTSLLAASRSEEHTSELQSQFHLVCRLL